MASHIEGRLLHLALPLVSATDKVQTYGLDDGDVYMSYENRFWLFSSVELYMTPLNFIESVTLYEPKMLWPSTVPRPTSKASAWTTNSLLKSRAMRTGLKHNGHFKLLLGQHNQEKRELDKKRNTPPVCRGSSNLFRNLRGQGAISYTEYLFLLCILTKPHAGFRIAFNMFDADGNEMVDKRVFMVLEEIFRKKTKTKEIAEEVERLNRQHDKAETTLLVHFFGKKGKAELKFEDFYEFMDNLQTELLEIEFLSFSKGMPTISEEDFAQILLCYTNMDDVSGYLENMCHSMSNEKGIVFEEFRSFFQFLNNLEDFTIPMQMYNFANHSTGQEEFTRAVYMATGIKLTSHLVNTVFKILYEDHDDKLCHKEFIGIMKDWLLREGGAGVAEKFPSFESCMKKELSGKQI
ncbi:LOW QUALITY PROTEIN: calcium uptake protein 3, mitochondrial [Aulostomus maculatus]